jgi:hypothetical protein
MLLQLVLILFILAAAQSQWQFPGSWLGLVSISSQKRKHIGSLQRHGCVSTVLVTNKRSQESLGSDRTQAFTRIRHLTLTEDIDHAEFRPSLRGLSNLIRFHQNSNYQSLLRLFVGDIRVPEIETLVRGGMPVKSASHITYMMIPLTARMNPMTLMSLNECELVIHPSRMIEQVLRCPTTVLLTAPASLMITNCEMLIQAASKPLCEMQSVSS